MRPAILLGIVIFSAGCASGPSADNPYPANYRQLAKDYVRKAVRDPYSLRYAEIATPKLAAGPGLLGNGTLATPWLVCVRANGKNAFGAYAGVSTIAIQVYQGAAVGAYDEYGELACSGAQYEPFPEIVAQAPVVR